LFNEPWLAFSGNVIMAIGLLIRVFAVLTLKEYYTRTLKIQENQKIIDVGLYKHLRHPGYLGLIMIWTGAGLSSNNYLILIIVALLTLSAYHYRMNSEEKMLIEAFGDDYKSYMKRTWRIVPLIY
jgi:protein-S-isoprenylcysteine O-methyltransferase